MFDRDNMLNCAQSACTPDMCSQHKTTSFPCANAANCGGVVLATLATAAPAFLDDESNTDRAVEGVLIDGRVYMQTPPVEGEPTTSTDPITGALVVTKTWLPRNKHAYLCAACSKPFLQQNPWKPPIATSASYSSPTRKEMAFTRFLDNTHALTLQIPESMSVFYSAAAGEQILTQYRIRPLGPACQTDVSFFLTKLQAQHSRAGYEIPYMHHRKGHDLKSYNVKNSRLPVKNYSRIAIEETGLEAGVDNTFYRLVLGVFDTSSGVLAGIFEMQLECRQTVSRRHHLVTNMRIVNVCVHDSVAGPSMCEKILLFALSYTRLLKDHFGTDVDAVSLFTEPTDMYMNTAARNCEFSLLWWAYTPPYTNKWTMLLRNNTEAAERTVRDNHFFQHLQVPSWVRPRREVFFGYMYNYEGSLRSSIHHTTMPSISMCEGSQGDYQIYQILEQDNEYPANQTWLRKQASFFAALSSDDFITLATYSHTAYIMINTFLTTGTLFEETDRSVIGRFSFVLDSLQFVVFQSQLLAVKGDDFRVRSAHDVERIAAILAHWNIDDWRPVFEAYVNDMRRLYDSAPALEMPMTTYRGEQSNNVFGRIADPSVSKQREFSFTLDATVAARFSRGELGGCIYKVTWQPGSKLILVAGIYPRDAYMEMEVRVMFPLFATTASCVSPRRLDMVYPDPSSRPPHRIRPDITETYTIIEMPGKTQ